MRTLDEIASGLAAVTPGPWITGDGSGGSNDGRIREAHGWNIANTHGHEANAEFIARAREDVPDLISEVRRLRADLATRTAEVERLRALLTKVLDEGAALDFAVFGSVERMRQWDRWAALGMAGGDNGDTQ